MILSETTRAMLLEEGRVMRRNLVGDAFADKLDKSVYADAHMAKFGEITQEVLFAQLWNRPGLDLKTKTLITLITDVTSGNVEALQLHVRFCRVHGWTENEVVEAILHCLGYIGVPLTRKALVAAVEALEEFNREQRQADVDVGLPGPR